MFQVRENEYVKALRKKQCFVGATESSSVWLKYGV